MDNYDIKCRIIEEELRSVWPEWHVADHLGGGSFGDVFRIYRDNHGIREDSALKVIQINDRMATMIMPSNAQDGSQPDIPEALFGEIQIMEALRGSPNIVNIEDFSFRRVGQTSTLMVRMELLTSLQDVLPGRNGEGTLSSIGEIIKLGKDICTALMYCESKGIIHRDIKPANLFVDRFGNYKVGDFGASKRMETVHVAQTMTGIGTISYMAPEIFRGRSYNNTVDIYAVGLVLYQLLNNGRMAFLPESGSYTTLDIDSANYKRLHGTAVPSLAGKYVAGERISRRLDATVRKACAVRPADRYRTANEFYDALALAEMPEKKAKPKFGKRAKSLPVASESLQGQQDAGPLHGGQQDTPPPVNASYSQPPKKGRSNEFKFVFAIELVCIIVAVVVGLGILPRGKGFSVLSERVEQSVVADTEESGSEEGITVDDSGAGISGSEEGIAANESGNETVTEEETVLGTISDSWEEIIAAGEDGTYIDKYQIGDTKELDLGDEGVIRMELVALDADELADGSGNAHMTWIAKDLLHTKHAMNEENTNSGGWPASDMRAWLQDSILPLFPDTVRSNIKEVKKYSYSSSDRGTISSTDKIWIPSLREVRDTEELRETYGVDAEDAGPEYLEAFPDDASRLRQRDGKLCYWWLRSSSQSSDSKFYRIECYDTGSYWDASWGAVSAIIEHGVAVGFCL